jgi:hypothetical protein
MLASIKSFYTYTLIYPLTTRCLTLLIVLAHLHVMPPCNQSLSLSSWVPPALGLLNLFVATYNQVSYTTKLHSLGTPTHHDTVYPIIVTRLLGPSCPWAAFMDRNLILEPPPNSRTLQTPPPTYSTSHSTSRTLPFLRLLCTAIFNGGRFHAGLIHLSQHGVNSGLSSNRHRGGKYHHPCGCCAPCRGLHHVVTCSCHLGFVCWR